MPVPRPAQAEAHIDLDAYRANLLALASCAPDAELMAVVKADGYGHGIVEMARAGRAAGAAWIGVATYDEALTLRACGDAGPLLCWLASPGADHAAVAAAGVDLTASSVAELTEILAAVPGQVRVQLQVDTGMARAGASAAEWPQLAQAAADAVAAGRLHLTGVWSHLACADQPDHPANAEQEARYRAALDDLAALGLDPGLRHLANSAATLTRPSAHFDLVRVGIASFGILPDPDLAVPVALRPVMTLQASLAAVRRVPAGTAVSYGHRYVTDRETTLGLVPVGYGDGIHRAATGRAEVGFAGQRVPVAGTICMDQLVIDLGDLAASPGDVVTLFGPGDDGEPTAEDWARAAGTIGYEIVTGLGGRIRRTYGGPR